MRGVAAPRNEPTLSETPRWTSDCRYSPSVVQSTSYLMSACDSTSSFFIAGVSGPIDSPSPKISVVTPCLRSDIPRPSAMSDSCAWLMTLMKPGAAARPCASISVRPRPRTAPTAAMRSPRMAMSPRLASAPVPSYNIALRMTTSYRGIVAQAESRKDANSSARFIGRAYVDRTDRDPGAAAGWIRVVLHDRGPRRRDWRAVDGRAARAIRDRGESGDLRTSAWQRNGRG